MKRFLLLALAVVLLAGCSTLNIQGRDVTKQIVDQLCPDPVVVDPKGSFVSGFLDRLTIDVKTTELSQRDLSDIKLVKAVCDTPVAERSDYQYGTIAGGAATRVMALMTPYMGKDAFTLIKALGMVVR